jgi:hypothetical protein
MARYREASNNLKFSLSETGYQAVADKDKLISIEKNMLTIYRMKDRLDRECCNGCRGVKPREKLKNGE